MKRLRKLLGKRFSKRRRSNNVPETPLSEADDECSDGSNLDVSHAFEELPEDTNQVERAMADEDSISPSLPSSSADGQSIPSSSPLNHSPSFGTKSESHSHQELSGSDGTISFDELDFSQDTSERIQSSQEVEEDEFESHSSDDEANESHRDVMEGEDDVPLFTRRPLLQHFLDIAKFKFIKDLTSEESELYLDFILDFISLVKGSAHLSESAADKVWSFILQWFPRLPRRGDEAPCLPQWRRIRDVALQLIPPIHIDYGVERKHDGDGEEAGAQHHKVRQKSFSRSSYPPAKYQKLYSRAYIDGKDLIKLAKDIHLDTSDPGMEVHFSVDGVQQSRSTSANLTVWSYKFPSCREVFTLSIMKKEPKQTIPHEQHLDIHSKVLQDAVDAGLKISKMLLDSPYRAFYRGQTSHNGHYACDICMAGGTSHGGVIQYFRQDWEGADTRTDEILGRIQESWDELNQDERLGYIRLDRPINCILQSNDNFSMIYDICDSMHTFGVVGFRYFRLALDIQSTRQVVTNMHQAVNEQISKISVPQELSRRPRNIYEWSVWKFQEIKFFWLIYAPVSFSLLPNDTESRVIRKDMAFLFFLSARAFHILDDNDFSNVKGFVREVHYKLLALQEALYSLYTSNQRTKYPDSKQYLKDARLTYLSHLYLCHAEQIRERGNFAMLSTAPFEGNYCNLLRGQVPGTESEAKQALQNDLMAKVARVIKHDRHRCTLSPTFKTENQCLLKDMRTFKRHDDSLVYVINKENTRESLASKYWFLRIQKFSESGVLSCKVIFTEKYRPPEFAHLTEILQLKPEDVEVFKVLKNQPSFSYDIQREDIVGKATIVPLSTEDQLILTISTQTLLE